MGIEGGESELLVPESAVLEIDMIGSVRETVVSKMTQAYAHLKRFEERFRPYPFEGFEIKHSKISLGRVDKFKDHVVLGGYCRLLPSVPQKVYEDWIDEIRLNCEELGIRFRIKEYKQAFAVDPKSDFVRACLESARRVDLDLNLGKLSLYTEASVFSRLGIECVVFGAGTGEGNIYGVDEKISQSDLERSTLFYSDFIERVCL